MKTKKKYSEQDEREEALRQILGKRIVAIRTPNDYTPFTGFDLVFDDVAELEVYVLDGEICFVFLTPDEAKEGSK